MAILAAGELSRKFEQAVSQNDFNSFRDEYRSFLSRFPAFTAAYSPVPTDLPVHSAIFGRTCFYLKQTNDLQAKALLDDGEDLRRTGSADSEFSRGVVDGEMSLICVVAMIFRRRECLQNPGSATQWPPYPHTGSRRAPPPLLREPDQMRHTRIPQPSGMRPAAGFFGDLHP